MELPGGEPELQVLDVIAQTEQPPGGDRVATADLLHRRAEALDESFYRGPPWER